MRRTLIMLALAAVLAVVGIATASAGTVHRYPSSVTIHFKRKTNADVFYGKVKSGHQQCIPGRKVVVKRKKPGNDAKVGTDITNAKGKWKVIVTPYTAPGKYYAKVHKKKLNQHHICKGATSGTITVH